MTHPKEGETLELKHILAAKEMLSRPQEPLVSFITRWEVDSFCGLGLLTTEEKDALLQGKTVNGMMVYAKPI